MVYGSGVEGSPKRETASLIDAAVRIWGWLPSQVEQEDFGTVYALVAAHIERLKKRQEDVAYTAFLKDNFGN